MQRQQVRRVQPGAPADAVDRRRFSKPSCPARLILFLYGPPRRVNCGQAVLIIVFITVVMFTMAV